MSSQNGSVKSDRRPAIAFFGGAALWYTAHELGLYFSSFNCEHRGVLPVIHVLCLAGLVYLVMMAKRSWDESAGNSKQAETAFAPLIAYAGSALFALVTFWQLIASFIFTGCER